MYIILLTTLSTALSPIVLVPGIAGGKIRMKLDNYQKKHWWCFSEKDWFDFWIDIGYLQPENVACVNDQFSLHLDNSTGLYFNTSGVYIDVVQGLEGIEYLDDTLDASAYFHDMIVYLVNGGYTREKNLQAAPYDWRLSADGLSQLGYFKRLQQQIEDSVTANGDRVILVSHSLGCLVSQAFFSLMDKMWVANHVKAWYALGPPFGGSAKMVLSIVSGYAFDIPLLPADYMHEIEKTSASGIALLPQAYVFGSGFPLVMTPTRNYTPSIDSVRTMFSDLGLDTTLNMYDWMRKWKAQSDQLPPPPSGLPVQIFYGTGHDTLTALTYDKDFTSDYDGTVSNDWYMDGDTTIAAISATAVNMWPGYTLGNVKLHPLVEVHAGLVRNKTVLAAILAAGKATNV